MLTGRRLFEGETVSDTLAGVLRAEVPCVDAAGALARRIAEAAPLAVKALKAVLEATQTLGIEEGYALMRSGKIEEYSKMLASEDAREGPRAFAEKREPQWRGR